MKVISHNLEIVMGVPQDVAVLASRILHGRNYSDMDKTERDLGHALADAHFGAFGADGYWRHAAPPAPNASGEMPV